MKKQIAQKLVQLRNKLRLEENRKTGEQIENLVETLNQYYFTEKQFNNACNKMLEIEHYGAMPKFSVFLNYLGNCETKIEAMRNYENSRNHYAKRKKSQFKMMLDYHLEGKRDLHNLLCKCDFYDSSDKKEQKLEFFQYYLKKDQNSTNIDEVVTFFEDLKNKDDSYFKNIYDIQNNQKRQALGIKKIYCLEHKNKKILEICDGNIGS